MNTRHWGNLKKGKHRTKNGSLSIKHYGPEIWNELDSNLIFIPNVKGFEFMYKKQLFLVDQMFRCSYDFHFISNWSNIYQFLHIKCYYIHSWSSFIIDESATYICIIFTLKFNVYTTMVYIIISTVFTIHF